MLWDACAKDDCRGGHGDVEVADYLFLLQAGSYRNSL